MRKTTLGVATVSLSALAALGTSAAYGSAHSEKPHVTNVQVSSACAGLSLHELVAAYKKLGYLLALGVIGDSTGPAVVSHHDDADFVYTPVSVTGLTPLAGDKDLDTSSVWIEGGVAGDTTVSVDLPISFGSDGRALIAFRRVEGLPSGVLASNSFPVTDAGVLVRSDCYSHQPGIGNRSDAVVDVPVISGGHRAVQRQDTFTVPLGDALAWAKQ